MRQISLIINTNKNLDIKYDQLLILLLFIDEHVVATEQTAESLNDIFLEYYF